MEFIEVTGKTVDDAILNAAIKLGTTRDQVSYEVLVQGSSGFLGIGSKNAVIRAHVRTEEEIANQEKAEKAVAEIVNNVNERAIATETVVNKAPAEQTDVKVFLNQVFSAMHLEVEVKITEGPEENEINIELSGDDMGVLIGKRGQTLDSLQYLASLVVNKGSEEYIRVKVDTENYRERRKETLENLAKNISFKVKKTRKPVALEPMNPYERRVIHSVLQNDKYVCTHSEGEESYRHVVIALKEGVRLDNYSNNKGKGNYNRNSNYKKKER